MQMRQLKLLELMPQRTGRMGTTGACQEGILHATTFLASPRMDLYPCLYSQLLKLGSAM
jgi:hypothetical protein